MSFINKNFADALRDIITYNFIVFYTNFMYFKSNIFFIYFKDIINVDT